MLRIAVLASGRGSNLLAMIDAIQRGELGACIVGVFSDKAASGALAHARAAGIHAVHVDPKTCSTRADFDCALFRAVDDCMPDLIVCAGFMRILSPEVVAARVARIINIHPSLLPNYPGLHTHQRAIAAGDIEHGASVHVVIPALDAGPVIAQTHLMIAANDTAESLAARLLPQEHRLLLQVLRWFAEGRLRFDADHIHFDEHELTAPLRVD
ncbi:MAG: phosphoribosylglycinamide formyltransferase [Rhodanobacteraceae bacterium]|nr:phosphoribosylglycinamide formyltransferase [Rhodanobacteraceae bacterium]HQW82316.1 phosphoribosylglycinamide formyltransferase [Pseudomonadota bacterium]